MAAVDEPRLAELHERADLVVADGVPLVWVGRLRGIGRELGRVAGADLLESVCGQSQRTGQSHFFYGGLPGVAEKMVERLRVRYPALKVAGIFSPPMRSIGLDFEFNSEVLAEVAHIKSLNPDFIWVGVSSPKQEYWMAKVAPLFGRGVFIGIGAAFNFHAGTVKRAPLWIQRSGFEWMHRLLHEPQRLWRRYLISAPRFVAKAAKETLLGETLPKASARWRA
jgi:N-acetylglucosaminyldiphosphoundecaprenol N-acetyl-beta-D-mannosaminyltransferase